MPDLDLILVTGGTRGIGRAVVDAALARGHRVAFTYRTSEAKARSLEDTSQGRATGFAFDLCDRPAAKSLVSSVEQTLGPIVGLVNNAGVSHSRLLAMTSDDDWDAVLDANLGGAFRLCRAVVPLMVSRRAGSIVNIASLGAVRGVAGQGAYAASKAALLAITRTLAREVGKRQVRVNAVVPGYVPTDMTGSLPERAITALRAAEALPRGTQASSVAATVVFLLSEGASAITGQSVFVDAGASV